MRAIASSARAVVRKTWWWLRQVSGDAAYENYLRWASREPGARRPTAAGPGRVGQVCRLPTPATGMGRHAPVLSPEEFYKQTLERRYAQVSRCC